MSKRKDMELLNEYDLCGDITLQICTKLPDKDKVQFLSTSKSNHMLKNTTYFTGESVPKYGYTTTLSYGISKIKDLWYFDRFTNITLDCHIYNILKFPLCATHLILNTYKMGMPYEAKPLQDYFSLNVTHLTISRTFNCFKSDQSPLNLIPATVTHLIWIDPMGEDYLKNRIPPNVTHLTIQSYDYRITRYHLPETITDLVVENWTSHRRTFTIVPIIKNTRIHWCDPN